MTCIYSKIKKVKGLQPNTASPRADQACMVIFAWGMTIFLIKKIKIICRIIKKTYECIIIKKKLYDTCSPNTAPP